MARKHNLHTGGQETEIFARFAGHHPGATIQTLIVMQCIERYRTPGGRRRTPTPENLVPILRWDIALIRHHYRILEILYLPDAPKVATQVRQLEPVE
jgi:hypothetical protein